MATSQVSRQDILARRRGRKFVHNAAEDLPEDLTNGAGNDGEGTEQDAGRGRQEAGTTAAATRPDPAHLADDDPGTDAASAKAAQGQNTQAQPSQQSVDDSVLRQAIADRQALEQRLRDSEAQLTQRQTRIAELESQTAELGALQSRFQETENELATARRREFEQNIERDIEAQVEALLADDTEGTYSHETARALVKRVMAPTITKLMGQFNDNEKRLNESFGQKLGELRTTLDTSLKDIRAERRNDSLATMNKAIIDKYPQFSKDIASREFEEFGSKAPRFSLDNYRTLLAKAYEAHDTQRVMEIMAEFDSTKSGRQDVLEGMAEVSIGQVSASRPAAAKQEVQYTYEDIADARRKLQNGEWDRKQFRDFKAQFEKAEKDGRVQG